MCGGTVGLHFMEEVFCGWEVGRVYRVGSGIGIWGW